MCRATLERARLLKGYSQNKLAELVGVSGSTIGHWETGAGWGTASPRTTPPRPANNPSQRGKRSRKRTPASSGSKRSAMFTCSTSVRGRAFRRVTGCNARG
ncbi:MAG: helix-turn-helix domain-containing protein [Acidobacteria bacterium]|nr:helix-turn-helix domain-containing protein [Acidobacteriota bacterium]NIQ84443.1 helix-turn-helix domain-containing protein [Acidobacteriota bacterium]